LCWLRYRFASNEAFMNKPATKEPSMDEILSSIRQIIADDDASATAPAPRPVPSPPPAEPLALSAAQMLPTPRRMDAEPSRPVAYVPAAVDLPATREAPVEHSAADPVEEILAEEAQLVDPEDIAFEPEPEPMPAPRPAPVATPIARAPNPEPRPAPRPVASVARAAPMPDADLSADIAEQLLAPATDAAVQGAISRLGAVASTGLGGMTVEAMIRDMLRPMLKDWLDENLPSMVERLVEKEIGRISRGVK
jgi:cell pole-organizing protein PopZ